MVLWGILHVVLERRRQTVVGETLGQFDNGHKPTGERDLSGDSAEGLHFLFGGFSAFLSGRHGLKVLGPIKRLFVCGDELLVNELVVVFFDFIRHSEAQGSDFVEVGKRIYTMERRCTISGRGQFFMRRALSRTALGN